jgi:hypothetical protein
MRKSDGTKINIPKHTALRKKMYGKFWKNYMKNIGMSGDAVGYHNILTH